ncbi:MAG: dihydroxy-acid dehydratase [Achromobacter sp.]|uniref:dihydroxy-acid dehydratase domain-containing protein n=1 Tax=Achromobacter sp. TaxID=134375 RepID=UPI0029BD0374|nr:dihydroxy-acid dehydratase [Achromobacter sp.]MDX3984358.1 dihydroxy-acid dehydratase [Achromobacter sp.]
MAEARKLRSQRWLAKDDFRTFNHHSRFMQMGFERKDWEGKPIVAIINSWSEFNPCHMHFRQRVDDVKRGVLQAGGFPLEMPAMSLNDALVKPSALLYRNLMAMEIEEMIRCYPVDAVVLMGGCDKTTPAMLLGAISAGVPAVFLPAGPMLRGHSRGKTLGSGSDAFKFWDDRRAGLITPHVIVLRNAGPKGGPGMPEWGMIPVPLKLVRQGVRDMLRISDARMSGTSYGACVLHVAPEAYVGGPLALVQAGDIIAIDVPGRQIRLEVSDDELSRRRAQWHAPPARFGRGYGKMFTDHILQADQGCDMDVLLTQAGECAGEPDIF